MIVAKWSHFQEFLHRRICVSNDYDMESITNLKALLLDNLHSIWKQAKNYIEAIQEDVYNI